jgi:hypothetical protein
MGRGTKALLALATVGVALFAASTAAAAPTFVTQYAPTFVTQYGNNTPLDCLQAPRWTGVMTVTSVIKRLDNHDARPNKRIDLDYDLTITFQPSNATQPSYTGTQRVSVGALLIPYFTASYDMPLSMALQGSDGSKATLSGGQTLVFSWKADRNIQSIGLADDGWACEA